MNKVSITHMVNTHNEWLSALNFYKDELSTLRQRLTEVAGKNSATEVMKQTEHFENQFKIQAENIDQLAHDIRFNYEETARQAENSSAGYIENELLQQQEELKHRYTELELVVNELRHKFNEFASVWM